MSNNHPLRVLLVTEGSGGHLIPALQVARRLVHDGARVRLWYATRHQTARLTEALLGQGAVAVETRAMWSGASHSILQRLWRGGGLWVRAHWSFRRARPDVVVGFGGWVSVPVVLAARQRRIPVLLHEQNVHLGRANRLLTRWASRVAVSFEETRTRLNGTPSVLTGLPVRPAIGSRSRREAADRFGLEAARPTLLVLGGSQGATAINRFLIRALSALSLEERRTWQVIHLTGVHEEAMVRQAYGTQGMRAYVAAHVIEMDAAYAQADVVIARAGGSTIAELAHCGRAAILIPYPLANGHQRANAQFMEAAGGGIRLEETEASPERLLEILRELLTDRALRERMAARARTLAVPDAAARVAGEIASLGGAAS